MSEKSKENWVAIRNNEIKARGKNVEEVKKKMEEKGYEEGSYGVTPISIFKIDLL